MCPAAGATRASPRGGLLASGAFRVSSRVAGAAPRTVAPALWSSIEGRGSSRLYRSSLAARQLPWGALQRETIGSTRSETRRVRDGKANGRENVRWERGRATRRARVPQRHVARIWNLPELDKQAASCEPACLQGDRVRSGSRGGPMCKAKDVERGLKERLENRDMQKHAMDAQGIVHSLQRAYASWILPGF
ncbi:hypothetical protein GY45DRAFT_645823 [Cubamyces sp. BRFM 1775]|nr:hypothetical protein GY45DRAFT_645823 [Cubamyces sp. BRFM 1775]